MLSERYGSGPRTVVGLHGWAGDHRTFEPLQDCRPDSVSFWALDLPGYGQSPAPAVWTLDAVAEQVASALRNLELNRFTLVGNCSGAIVGLHLARKMRGRIDRLVMIDPFAYMPWYFKLFLRGQFGRRAYEATFASRLGRALTNRALQHKRTADSHLTSSFAAVNHETVYRYLQMLDENSNYRQFADVEVPITLIHGERTFAAVKRSIDLWTILWPQAERFELQGAGHLPIEETPQKLASLIFNTRSEVQLREEEA
jgi:pimeloyl-ACP methyl ester carboxylesterase